MKKSIMWILSTFFGSALVEFCFSLQSKDFSSMTGNEISHFFTGSNSLKVAIISGTLWFLMLRSHWIKQWIKKKFQLAQTGIKMKLFHFIKDLIQFINS